MKRTTPGAGNRPGFTLIEILVAVGLAGILMTVMFTMFRTSQRSYTTQDEVAEMQQNLRVAMMYVSRDLRMAGLGGNLLSEMVPSVQVFTGEVSAWNMNKAFTIINSDVGPDQIDIFYGSITDGEYVATTTKPMADASAELVVTDPDEFQEGDAVVITDGLSAALFVVSSVEVALKKLGHDSAGSIYNPPAGFNAFPTGGGYSIGARVYNFGKLHWVRYYIDQTDPFHPKLMADYHDGQPDVVIADGIEDMQLYYYLKDGTETDDPTGKEDDIRAVRITFVARTNKEDQFTKRFNQPVIEDHDPGAAPQDGYRRMVLSSTIQCRNMGL